MHRKTFDEHNCRFLLSTRCSHTQQPLINTFGSTEKLIEFNLSSISIDKWFLIIAHIDQMLLQRTYVSITTAYRKEGLKKKQKMKTKKRRNKTMMMLAVIMMTSNVKLKLWCYETAENVMPTY